MRTPGEAAGEGGVATGTQGQVWKDGQRDRRPLWGIVGGGMHHWAPAGFRQKDGVLSATSKGRFTGMKRLEAGSLSGG